MKGFLTLVVSLVVCGQTLAAPKKGSKGEEKEFAPPALAGENWSLWDQASYPFKELPKVAPLPAIAQRKVAAADRVFTESDLSPDMICFRAEMIGGTCAKNSKTMTYQGVKTGAELAALLKRSADPKNYATYSDDLKYFLAPLHIAIPLQGIVWRVRPIFEKSGMGNKATHGQSVQLVRNVVTAMKTMFPTDQWKAGVEFFTQPSPDFPQMKSVRELQRFMITHYVKAVVDSKDKIEALYKTNPDAIYTWDNKIGYGTGTFDDGLNRFVGHGRAEKEISLAVANSMIHDAYFFSAYNQDYIIQYAKEIGQAFGIDSLPSAIASEDMGVTSEERSRISRKLVSKGWMSGYAYKVKGEDGKETMLYQLYMDNAWDARRQSVGYFNRAYKSLQGADASHTMLLNPLYFQPISNKNLEPAVRNMNAIIEKSTSLRSPVTGESVEVDLAKLYKPAPESLAVFLPNGWDHQLPSEIKDSVTGEKYRNYLRGRATSWDNSPKAWGALIPSAQGQSPDYMAKARRVIATSRGASGLFGVVNAFVE